jgi:release factor glutamine methyltransferase
VDGVRTAARRPVGKTIEAAAEAFRAAGCDEPLADARAIVADVLRMEVEQLARCENARLVPELAERVEQRVRRRVAREPLAYILGRVRFREVELEVDERVLIPRRETGLLVDVAIELPRGARVHEVGTGSGAVALALMSERPDLRVTASDLSADAVAVARTNAVRLGLPLAVKRLAGLPARFREPVDLVLANLPYVTEETIDLRSPEIRREPHLAVTGACGPDGLGVIRGLVEEAPPGMRLALEHDTHHGPAMRGMLADATTLLDHEGEERVTVGWAP